MTETCPDWVSPDPFRRHVRDLICETGLSWRMIAAHAGIAPRALQSLLHGRRGGTIRQLHVTTARALAATTADTIADAALISVDMAPSRQLLASLRTAGHAEALHHYLRPGDLERLDDPDNWQCSQATAARVTACYDLLTQPGLSRVTPAHDRPGDVDCGQQSQLDRKQTTSRWRTSGSISPISAGTSGC